MLIVDSNALESVDLLDLIDKIFGELFATLYTKDIVRVLGALHDGLTGANPVALKDGDVLTLIDRVGLGLTDIRGDDDRAFGLGLTTVGNDAVNLGDQRLLFGGASLEKLGDARQTTGDILILRGLTRDLGQDHAGLNFLVLTDKERGTHRKEIARNLLATLFVTDDNPRPNARVTALADDFTGQTGILVETLFHRDAFDDVAKGCDTDGVRKDGCCKGLPLGKNLTGFNTLAFFEEELCAVDQRIALALAAVLVDDTNFAVAGHDDQHLATALLALHRLQVIEPDLAAGANLVEGLLDRKRPNATDMEGTHRQLRAGLTDGLRGDGTDGFTDVDQATTREVAPVAQRANAAHGVTGKRRANPNTLQTGVLDACRNIVDNLGVDIGQQLVVLVPDGLKRDAPKDAVAQGFHDLAALIQRRHRHTVQGATVVLHNHAVIGHVDQSTGQITGVCGLEGGIRESLAGTVSGDEILQYGETLAEVCGNRVLDDLTGGLGHQTTHPGELAHLLSRASSARVGHNKDRVKGPTHHRLTGIVADIGLLGDLGAHLLGHILGGVRPDINHEVIALTVGDHTLVILGLNLVDLAARAVDNIPLIRRDDHVVDGDGNAGVGRPVIPDGANGVGQQHAGLIARAAERRIDDAGERLLVEHLVDQREGELVGADLIEDHPTDGGGDMFAFMANPDARLQIDHAVIIGHAHFVEVRIESLDRAPVGVFAVAAARKGTLARQPVAAQHDILGRHDDRATVRRREHVIGAQKQHARLGLRLQRQRHVHGHLVAVEVGVIGHANQRMKLNRLAFDQQRLECLDTKTVQGGRTVQQHRVLLDHLIENIPDLVLLLLHHLLGTFDGGDVALLFELIIDKRLEELERHLLGQTALVQLELGTDDDDRTTGIVDAFTQKVLAEAALLSLDHIAQGFQRTLIRTGDGLAATAVIKEGIDRLLKHALLVAHDDFGCVQLKQALKTVMAVDHAAIQIVEIRGRKAPAVQRNQGAQVGRKHRDNVKNQPGRLVLRVAYGFHDLEALGDALALGVGGRLLHLGAQLLRLQVDIHLVEQLTDRLGAHIGFENVAVVVEVLHILLFAEHLADDQRGQAGIGDDIRHAIKHLLEVF